MSTPHPTAPARNTAGPARSTSPDPGRPLTLLLPSGPFTVPRHAPAAGVGTVAHLLIALLAPAVPDLTPSRLVHECFGLSHQMVAPSRAARLNATLAAGFAVEYLRDLRPAAPWEMLGAEYDCGYGRVDVAYRHGESGRVLFDEVKTTHVPLPTLDKTWIEQATRYAVAGAERFGDLFVGCRILPLGARHLTSVVLPSGRAVRIDPTVQAPLTGVLS